MGSFSPIPSYDHKSVDLSNLIQLEKFIMMVHEAGQAYLDHSCGHDDVESSKLNPTIPVDSTITVTVGKTATTGCFNWYSRSSVESDLDSLENQFRVNASGSSYDVIAEVASSFLVNYFHTLCRVCEQKFSYWTLPISDEKSLTWSGIGLKTDQYLTIEEYKEIVKSTVEDYVFTEKIISADTIHNLISYLMQVNSQQEMIYDHGFRSILKNQSGSYRLPGVIDGCYGASSEEELVYMKVQAKKDASEYMSKYHPDVSDWSVSFKIVGQSYSYTLFHADVVWDEKYISAAFPDDVITNLHEEIPMRSQFLGSYPKSETFMVSLSSNNESLGYVIGSGQYYFRDQINAIAIETLQLGTRPGVFDKWSDGSVEKVHPIEVLSDVNLTAYFYRIGYQQSQEILDCHWSKNDLRCSFVSCVNSYGFYTDQYFCVSSEEEFNQLVGFYHQVPPERSTTVGYSQTTVGDQLYGRFVVFDTEIHLSS